MEFFEVVVKQRRNTGRRQAGMKALSLEEEVFLRQQKT